MASIVVLSAALFFLPVLFAGIVSPVPSNDYAPVDSLLRDVTGESE